MQDTVNFTTKLCGINVKGRMRVNLLLSDIREDKKNWLTE